MNWVEGIGPAGIGKTTFYRKLLSSSSKKDTWVTEEFGLSEIIQNPKKPDLKKNFLKYYFKQDIINVRKKQHLNSQYLFGNEVLNLEGKKYNALLDSYLTCLQGNHKKEIFESLSHFLWYVKIVKTMCAFDHHNYKKLVFFDEGPFQNHPNLVEVDCKESIVPKGLILFHLEPELNIKRIRKRMKDGTIRIIHKGLGTQELMKLIELEYKKNLEKESFLKKLNIPIIDVDLSEDSSYHVSMVQAFLSDISKTVSADTTSTAGMEG